MIYKLIEGTEVNCDVELLSDGTLYILDVFDKEKIFSFHYITEDSGEVLYHLWSSDVEIEIDGETHISDFGDSQCYVTEIERKKIPKPDSNM